MAYATLVGLKLTSAGGLIERDIVVQECITMFNLHKVFQFCLNSRQSDDSIAAKRFVFKHGGSEVKPAKSTKLYHAAGHGAECQVGKTLTYECDGNSYVMTVTAISGGDARFYVPRCVGGFGGSINIDNTNKKLLVRRFTAGGANKGQKKPPKVWCARGTPASVIMNSHLACMREPLYGYQGW